MAVVVASQAIGEGMDRASLALPGDQDRLIAAVAEANPRTVVVLTGGPGMMPWLDQVGAVLQAWLPGQQFGQALAAVLFGDADPGSRLPVTFPATPGQGPITGPERWPGVGGDARYDVGVLAGYRWYDQHGQEPLFCFGHGLSYAEYTYGQLGVERDEATGAVTVTVPVTNTGGRAGVEVVQLNVAAPEAAAQPPQQLKGFARSASTLAPPPRSPCGWARRTSPPTTRRRGPGSSTRAATSCWPAGHRGTSGDRPGSRSRPPWTDPWCRNHTGSWRTPRPSRPRRGCGG